ncbi:MAG: hypothetical protein QG671_2984 [Actinomycetota bacterium]|nr:hypothetical protein [Actinomycetota bacterium]
MKLTKTTAISALLAACTLAVSGGAQASAATVTPPPRVTSSSTSAADSVASSVPVRALRSNPVESVGTALRMSACPDDGYIVGCGYITNNAQVFTGENTLGPAEYSLTRVTNDHGRGDDKDFPQKLGSSGEFKYRSDGAGVEQTGYYKAPAPLPDTDEVGFHLDSPYWGTNKATCEGSRQYTVCTATLAESGRHANYAWTMSNLPTTVGIRNNLQSTAELTRVGSPAVGNFILDAKGGNPTKIANDGKAGYFGMYRKAGTNNSFDVTYVVKSGDPLLNNATVKINPIIGADGKNTGKCTVQAPSSSSSLFCDMDASGGADGPVSVSVNIHQ